MKRILKTLAFIIFANINNYSVFAQIITPFAGGGSTLGDGGPATAAQVLGPQGAVFDMQGNYYVACDNRIRMVSPLNIITTIAGTGVSGFGGDGVPATAAMVNSVHDVALDTAGNLLIADVGNNRIRRVDQKTGIITTIAGNGTAGFSGDGLPATNANLNTPWFICIDKNNNLYISDQLNQRIRKVNPSGIISTIAGTGIAGYNGDNGLADTSELYYPNGITTDSVGNLYIAEVVRVRKVDVATGIITTVAGNGLTAVTVGGIPATSSKLKPIYLRFDAEGNLYCSDDNFAEIYRINTTGTIYTVAGNGTPGFSGDGGPATAAQLKDPNGLAVDGCGSLYISDAFNAEVRKVTYPIIYIVPAISLSGTVIAKAGTTVTVTATVANAGPSYAIRWMNHGIQFATTTVPFVSYTKGPGIDTITARVVSTATWGCYDSTTSVGHIVTIDKTGVASPHLSSTANGSLWTYPNPVADVLYLDIEYATLAGVQYQVLDMVGRTLLEGVLNTDNISVHQLSRGMYMIRIIDNERQAISKFVKE